MLQTGVVLRALFLTGGLLIGSAAIAGTNNCDGTACARIGFGCGTQWIIDRDMGLHEQQVSGCTDAILVSAGVNAYAYAHAIESFKSSFCGELGLGGYCFSSDSGDFGASTTTEAVGCFRPVVGSAWATVSGPFVSELHHADHIRAGEETGTVRPTGAYSAWWGNTGSGYIASFKSVYFPTNCASLGVSYGISMNDSYAYVDSCDPSITLAWNNKVVFAVRVLGNIVDNSSNSSPIEGLEGVVGHLNNGSLVKLGALDAVGIDISDLGGGATTVGGTIDVPMTLSVSAGSTLNYTVESHSFAFNCDVDHDGDVDWTDLDLFIAMIGSSINDGAYTPRADFNLSGTITATDGPLMRDLLNAGFGSAVPFGDVNHDSTVDCADAIAAAAAWGRSYPDSAYKVELDYNLDGVLDATDKAQFDSIVSCTQTAATCGPGWIGGASLPSSSTIVRAVTTWDHDGFTTSGPLPAALVVAYANGGTSAIYRWDGATWTSLATGISGSVDVLSVDSNDNSLLAAGSFSSIGGTSANNVARFNGTSWTALGSGTNGRVRAIGTDPVFGYLAFGGDFTEAGGSGSTARHLAMWDGSAWSELGGGTNGNVYALAIDPNGALAVGGSFTQANGSGIGNGVALWDGSSWSAMGSAGVANNAVLCFATSNPSGALIVGGSFTSISGVSGASRIAKWDGSAWSALGSGFDGPVETILRQTSNKLIVGGAFTASGTSPMSRAAKWTGSAWNSMATGVAGSSSEILSLVELPSHEVVAGGVFSISGGVAAGNLGRWSESGKPWIAVQPPHGQTLTVSGSASMPVTAAPGYDFGGALAYEWKHATTVVNNGAAGASVGGGTVTGATTATLGISSLATSDKGIYKVKVSNGCGYILSENSTLGNCTGDHDGNGQLEVADIFSFLNDWFATCVGSPLPGGCTADADFNGGGLAIDDIFDFLNAWFAGCS